MIMPAIIIHILSFSVEERSLVIQRTKLQVKYRSDHVNSTVIPYQKVCSTYIAAEEVCYKVSDSVGHMMRRDKVASVEAINPVLRLC